MKQTALLVALSMAAITLAGCTAQSEPEAIAAGVDGEPVDVDSVNLGNKGAVEGLVVDDNYRPVQLKQDWGNSQPGDYQDIGFVLVIETGQRYETTENGEFNIFPLEPGTYTLRVAADAHEAKDYKVNVVKGEWSEATLEARRQYSGGGTQLSQEYTLFINCSLATSAVRLVQGYGCGDLSGDSGRYGFSTDYTGIESDVRGMVTEMYAHQEGYHGSTIRWGSCTHDNAHSTNGCVYGEFEVNGEARWGKVVDYPRLQIIKNDPENFDDDEYLEEGEDGWCHPIDGPMTGCSASAGRFFAFYLGAPFNTILFPDGPSRHYQDQVTDTAGTNRQWGNGVVVGVRAQYLQTVWLYELPDEGIGNFCALCDDAAIPE